MKSTTTGSWEVWAGANGAAPQDMGTAKFDSSGKLIGTVGTDGNPTAVTNTPRRRAISRRRRPARSPASST
ncbi:hypothetical protein PPH41_43830 [Burkholderia gladioli]|nr:hypothetical protein [Burkholderia gladioli]